MIFAQRKFLVLAAWAGTATTVGLILAVDNPEMWALVASLVIIPVIIANWLWDAPEPTLSELVARSRSRP